MKAAPEREVRFDVDPGFALPALRGRPLTRRTFTYTYYDTPGHRLLRAGITLRRRVESRSATWELAIPADNGTGELEERGGRTLPGGFRRLLSASLRDADAEPVAQLRTVREGVALGPLRARVEVAVETTAALVGGRVAGRSAQAVASTRAENADLDTIAKKLRASGARQWDGAAILAQLFPEPEPPPDDGEPLTRLRRLLAVQYETALATDPGVRLGRDPEAVHQLRVATRRARALLRAAKGLVDPDWADGLRRELGWLGALLGPVRDLDVLLEHLDEDAAATLEGDDVRAFRRIRARLSAERDVGRVELLAAMGTPRYFRLLDVLESAHGAPAGEIATPLQEIAAREFARLRRAVKALGKQPGDDALHEVRIDTKRARYAAELAAPVLGKPGTRFLECAKAVQDVIGDHQDACVAEERLRVLARRGGGKTGLAAGRLIERQRRRKKSARRAFPGAWNSLARAGRRAYR